jgi:hypothetical protein
MQKEETGARTGLVSALLGAAVLAVLGAIGIALKQPWLFPSLGPTLMVLAETPTEPAADALNVLVGHVVGIGAGLLALVAFGLREHPSAVQEGLSWPRVGAVCLAIALTALVLQLLHRPHPPAGATTLIVALGILHTGTQLRTMLLAVAALTLVAAVVQLVHARQEGAKASSTA